MSRCIFTAGNHLRVGSLPRRQRPPRDLGSLPWPGREGGRVDRVRGSSPLLSLGLLGRFQRLPSAVLSTQGVEGRRQRGARRRARPSLSLPRVREEAKVKCNCLLRQAPIPTRVTGRLSPPGQGTGAVHGETWLPQVPLGPRRLGAWSRALLDEEVSPPGYRSSSTDGLLGVGVLGGWKAGLGAQVSAGVHTSPETVVLATDPPSSHSLSTSSGLHLVWGPGH